MIFGGRPEEKHQKARLLLAAVQNLPNIETDFTCIFTYKTFGFRFSFVSKTVSSLYVHTEDLIPD